MKSQSSLFGLNVLITRPRLQAKTLQNAIESLGGKTFIFPTIEIEPLKNKKILTKTLTQLHQFDIAIFTSANAVHIIKPFWKNASYPLITIAIGSGTAKALQQYNIVVDYIPNQFNSEGILALPILQNVYKKKIVIFCGENPRTLLSSTLSKQEAIVSEIFCYSRKLPKYIDSSQIKQIQLLPIDIIVSSSKESLNNLYQLMRDARRWLLRQKLLVISPAMVELAKQLQFTQSPVLAPNPTDDAILTTLQTWYQSLSSNSTLLTRTP